MNHLVIIARLAENRAVFQALAAGVEEAQARWRPAPDKWSFLEVINHLHDEEREDFRRRIELTLADPQQSWPAIAPAQWVTQRGYQQRGWGESLAHFLNERERSIGWLKELTAPNWNATHHHPKLGAMSAEQLLANWLAHDFHHIRQLNALHYGYLAAEAQPLSLAYAGNW